MSTSRPPTPDEQVQFLRRLQRLLEEGKKTASYKFALVRALADLSLEKGDDSGAELQLHATDIAVKFIEFYWGHVEPFPGLQDSSTGVLRQNTGARAKVLSLIDGARGPAGNLSRLRRIPSEWKLLVGGVARVVREQPLWKLQTIGDQTLDFLYPNEGKGSNLVLRPGVAFCLRRFRGLILDLVLAEWVRFVRQLNARHLGDKVDIETFLFRPTRQMAPATKQALLDVQQGRCFYCGRGIRSGAADHFIPFSRCRTNLGHNFVLADDRCNSSKSDTLAGEEFLNRWILQNEQHGADLESAFLEDGLSFDWPVSRRVAVWAYGQTEGVGGHVWRPREGLHRLEGGWRAGSGEYHVEPPEGRVADPHGGEEAPGQQTEEPE